MKKINLRKIVFFAIAFLASTTLSAQGIMDLRINEVLINNTSGIVNGEGTRSGWVELRNSGYSTVDLGGCTLVEVTPQGRNSHTFPKGLSSTVFPSQNYTIVYLGANTVTPFTAHFNLQDATALLIYDASGKILIDSVSLHPSTAMADVSLGRAFYDKNKRANRDADRNFETRDCNLVATAGLTPGNSNFPVPTESRSEAFRRIDFTGGGMSVIAMSVVFLALLCLFLVFQQVGNAMQRMARKKDEKAAGVASSTGDTTSKPIVSNEPSGEMLAAIAYAIKLYNDELNESETRVITINRTVRAYSPWSSKIYGLTQLPNRTK